MEVCVNIQELWESVLYKHLGIVGVGMNIWDMYEWEWISENSENVFVVGLEVAL